MDPVPRRRTIRSTVITLVIACVLPAWLLAAAVMYTSYQRERDNILDEVAAATRRMMRAVESELAANQATLYALAASNELDRGNLAAFYRQAAEVLPHTTGFTIVLSDPSGQQLLNLTVPFGTALPKHGSPETLEEVMQGRVSVVSNVFESAVTHTPIVTVEVPVLRNGTAVYALAIGIDLLALSSRIEQQRLPHGWVAAVLDRQGKFVARLPGAKQYVGKKAVQPLREAIARWPEGMIEATTTEGIPVLSFFTHSPTYGWSVAIGVPTGQLTAGLWKSLRYYTVGGLALLLAGLALAVALGRRIAKPVQALVGPALALGRGETIALESSGMSEPDEVGGALMKAQDILQQHEAERDEAQEKLALAAMALDSAAEGVIITRDGRIVSVNRAVSSITGYAPEEIIGEPLTALHASVADSATLEQRRRTIAEQGHWQGEVWGRRKNGELYPAWSSVSRASDHSTPAIHVCVFSDISAAKEYEERLHHLAHYDALTGLPNRLLFRERLAEMLVRAERHGNMLAVLFIDLDRFKPINDTLGHEAGDELLRRVAERLQACVRASDTTARLGGDEFAVLLDELRAPEEAGVIARNILDTLERPYVLRTQPHYISASIGIGCYPSDSTDGETLLRQADMAMYQAKRAGRNAYQFFAPEFNVQASERLFMANSLRTALERDELRLVYQPLIDLATGEATGLEALVRWEHPEKGTVLPSRFISLAEEAGLIEPIGEWVLREAGRCVRRWKDIGLFAGRIAVNLSPKQFARDDLAARVLAVLAESGLVADDLDLEVTEGMVMEHPERAAQILSDLADAGVTVSIDDFGTGYSSLAYLKRFPVHSLKIDRSFVSGLPNDRNDRSLTRAVVAVAKSLGLVVVAEGVESQAQCDFLRKIGCDLAQGHFFSRPLGPAAVESFLSAARDGRQAQAGTRD